MNKALLLLSAFAAIGFTASGQFAQSGSEIRVDAAKVLNDIPATVYGSCIEDVNHEIYGGLYDQLIMGESFEEPASGLNGHLWRKCGGYWAADREYDDGSVSIVPGRHTRRMVGQNDVDVEPDESARLICDSACFGDFVYEADLRFLQARQSGASLLVRTSDVGIGENAMNGYEIRLNRENRSLQLIRHQQNERLLTSAPVSFVPSEWNHLRIECNGERVAVYLNDAKNAAIDYNDNSPGAFLKGGLGVAIAGTPSAFRNAVVTNGGVSTKLPMACPDHIRLSDRWDAIDSGNVQFTLMEGGALNGTSFQRIALDGAGKAGVVNRGLNRWGIAVVKAEPLSGSIYLQSDQPGLPVVAALQSRDGAKTYAEQTLRIDDRKWKKYEFTLNPDSGDTAARIAFYISQSGIFDADQATLRPTGSREFHQLPLRADIGNALVDEGLSFIRYAGTMVNAHGYRFHKMTGDRTLRPPYRGHWNEFASNGFGITEFLEFAEAARLPAAFAINIEETASDAAAMVDYLTGKAGSAGEKKRTEDGHPAPFAVKYIELGNEEVMFEGDDAATADHYIARFLDLAGAIHGVDPTIALVCSAWWRPESPNTEKIFKAIDGQAAYWDLHVGGDDPRSGLAVDTALGHMQKLFQQWRPGSKMKCVIFEENGSRHDLQRALGHASNLNAVRRHGEFVLTSCAANALQPYLQNDNSWDQGQIFFTPTRVWGMPPFYAQQMASRNHLPERLSYTVSGTLDVTATRSKDGSTIVLHIVNADSVGRRTKILVDHFENSVAEADTWTLAGDPSLQNLPGKEENVVPLNKKLKLNGAQALEWTVPPHSYVIIRYSGRLVPGK